MPKFEDQLESILASDADNSVKQTALLFQIRNKSIQIHGWIVFMGVCLIVSLVFGACNAIL